MYTINTAQRRARLGQRHFLAAGAKSAINVAEALLGLHSSDPATPYLSCQARVDGFDALDLEQALYEDRTLLRMLGMRRTMFVVPPQLGEVIDAACTQRLVGGQRQRLVGYIEAQGITTAGDAWLEDVESRTMEALADLGEATARDLTARVPELAVKLSFGHGKKWAGQVGLSTRVLFLLATSNRIIRTRPRGGWTSTQYRWARTDQWLDTPFGALDRPEAQTQLVAKWLTSYGPGTLTDIKWWTGWGVGLTRAALAGCGAVEVDLGGEVGYVLPGDLETPEETEPWAALLPSLDLTVMGWKDRDWYLGEHQDQLYDSNGNAGPTIWSDGRIVGGWAQHPDGEIRLEYLEPLSNAAIAKIELQAEALQLWLGERRHIPRFRTPVERRLNDSEGGE